MLYDHIRTTALIMDSLPSLLKLPFLQQIPYWSWISRIPGIGLDSLVTLLLPVRLRRPLPSGGLTREASDRRKRRGFGPGHLPSHPLHALWPPHRDHRLDGPSRRLS
jgi:hypothetical protein